MKKNLVAIIVSILLIVAGVCIASAAFIMAGYSFEGLSGERFERESVAVKEEFEHIFIDVQDYDVAILPVEGGTSLIDFDESENLGIVYELDRDMLVIKARDNRKWFDFIGINTVGRELKLYLPKSAYTSLTVSTATGDVTVTDDFSFIRSSVTTSTGDIKFRAKVTEDLDLSVSTGDINLSGQELTGLSARVSTGNIFLENVKAKSRIKLECNTGKVELHGIEAGGITSKGTTGDIFLKNVYVEHDIVIERSTGDVTLTSVIADSFTLKTSTGDIKLNSSDGGTFSINTSSGDVEGTLLTEKIFIAESSTGKIKVPNTTSGGTCKIRTSTGDIEIIIE